MTTRAIPYRAAAAENHDDATASAVGRPWIPPTPERLEDTGLSREFVSDLLLKTLYVQGGRDGAQLEAFLKLPFFILDAELQPLQQRQMVEGRGDRTRRGYRFELTDRGRTRAREVLQQNQFVGPAPVSLNQYWASVKSQSSQDSRFSREHIREAFSHLVLDDEILEALGPAVNSGRSVFLYGTAGNGKSALAEAVANIMGDTIYIPRTLEVDGAMIGLYDPVLHQEVPDKEAASPETPAESTDTPDLRGADQRFVRIRRPVVIVGGELTLEELELQLDSQLGLYRAPPQLKANGGVFVIDDFGRQRVRPRDLLNRWMIPLERRVDYLSIPMGQKIPVPFDCLVMFATNLDPAELVEEAFLRRIQYKILVRSPNREQYAQIWRKCCERQGVPFRPEDVDYIWERYYSAPHLSARACHPRDITNRIQDITRYRGMAPTISRELLDEACSSYFLEAPATGPRPGKSE